MTADARGNPRPESDVAKGTINQNPPGLSLWALLREDWEAHDRDFLAQGFWAIGVHRYGNWRLTVRSRVLRPPLGLLYWILYRIVEWTCGISLYGWVKVGRRVHIWHHGGIVLGGEIGDDVHIRPNTTLGTARTGDGRWMTPVVGDRVDIGVGAVILGPITIGHDSIIGANAVVLKDVPPHHVAVGVPAVARPERRAGGPDDDTRATAPPADAPVPR